LHFLCEKSIPIFGDAGDERSPVGGSQEAGERYHLGIGGSCDGWVICGQRPVRAVEDTHPPPELFVVLALSMPLPADVLCGGESEHHLFPPEPADQPQVLLVGLKDVRLVVEAWLGGYGGRSDPAPVAQAYDLLRVCLAPDRLGCAVSEGA
jgi:hypothetical protein